MTLQALLNKLRNLSNIGKKVQFYDRDNKEYYDAGTIINEVGVLDEKYGYKHFIQKIDYEGNIKYRFCYYAVDKNREKIKFGQFSSTMNVELFKKLIKKAIEQGFLI